MVVAGDQPQRERGGEHDRRQPEAMPPFEPAHRGHGEQQGHRHENLDQRVDEPVALHERVEHRPEQERVLVLHRTGHGGPQQDPQRARHRDQGRRAQDAQRQPRRHPERGILVVGAGEQEARERPAGDGEQQVRAAEPGPEMVVLADDEHDGQRAQHDHRFEPRPARRRPGGDGPGRELAERDGVPPLGQLAQRPLEVGRDADVGQGVPAEVDERRLVVELLPGEGPGEDLADGRGVAPGRGPPRSRASGPRRRTSLGGAGRSGARAATAGWSSLPLVAAGRSATTTTVTAASGRCSRAARSSRARAARSCSRRRRQRSVRGRGARRRRRAGCRPRSPPQ